MGQFSFEGVASKCEGGFRTSHSLGLSLLRSPREKEHILEGEFVELEGCGGDEIRDKALHPGLTRTIFVPKIK